MGSGSDDELRRLRERAYGPAADIDDDVIARDRLRRLEERRFAAAAQDAGTRITPPAVAGEALRADRPRRPRSQIAIAAAVLVAVVLATFGITRLTTSSRPAPPFVEGTAQVATLRADPGWDVPSFLTASGAAGTVGLRGFEAFHGLRAVTERSIRTPDDLCLYLMSAGAADSSDETADAGLVLGCGAGAFPATVTLRVDDTRPEALRAHFPDGTALQFVYDESRDEVIVLSDGDARGSTTPSATLGAHGRMEG